MQAVLVFDADNTLWDTDSVFRAAQLAVLSTLAEAGIISDPYSQLGTLRTVDQELIRQLGRAEYDFSLLPTALIAFYTSGLATTEAARIAIAQQKDNSSTGSAKVVRAAYQAFEE